MDFADNPACASHVRPTDKVIDFFVVPVFASPRLDILFERRWTLLMILLLHSLVRDPLLRCSEMWIISFFFFAVIPIILLVPLSLFP